MNHVCIKIRISFLFLLSSFIGLSQTASFDTAVFYRHLVKENLLPEQIEFTNQLLKLYPGNRPLHDSLFLALSLAYNKLGNTSQMDTCLARISDAPLFSSASSKLYASLLILGKEYNSANCFVKKKDSTRVLPFYHEASLSLAILQNNTTAQDTSVAQLSPTMRNIKQRYEHPPRHSAFLAGFYSAIFPGLGKLYLGYKQEALSACIENLALGGMAAESYFKAGPLSARFIITGTLFALFYGGNIWGSAILAKKQRIDYRQELDYEIFNYYHTNISSDSL